MITEDYVSFETAKLLKEKGFREWCSMCHSPSLYYNGDILDGDEESELKASGEWDETKARWIHTLYPFNCNNEQSEGIYAAPTLAMAMKWLRKEHNLYVKVEIGEDEGSFWYDFDIIPVGGGIVPEVDETYIYYEPEEALEAGIKYALEKLIKV